MTALLQTGDALLDALAALGVLSDPLAWLVVATFLGAALLDVAERREARPLAVVGWVLFGLFWLTLVHHFVVVQKSIVEGVGVALAVPGCLYAGYLLANGRESLMVLSRAVGVMGLVFFPIQAIGPARQFLIESVTQQTEFVMGLLGQTAPTDFTVVSGATVDPPRRDYQNTFEFYQGDHRITYTILVACTGLGSMAIFAGPILAVRAPWRRKLRALAVSIPVIYGLNIARNVFIAIAFGQSRLQVFPTLVMDLFGTTDPYMVSYYVADRLLAQFLSVVALVGITWFVVRELPEIAVVLDDALYLLTRKEYDLAATLGADPSGDRPTAAATDRPTDD
ncbi:archaeosortase A [Halomarina oriensis]|uniref:Archaeosortase A n=1 Tax=Halomarina oriensis TaxID=671145 RepID=A0A6B0GFA9_9EURY|nr:archaeosortase A [Halomarina oriensis]MWG33512.1 archaeosortase A [Halomarina oriensis]